MRQLFGFCYAAKMEGPQVATDQIPSSVGNRLSKKETVSSLVVLNRKIELIPRVVDIPLHGFSGDLEGTVRPARSFDRLVDELHPGSGHPRRGKPGGLTSGHGQLGCQNSHKDTKTRISNRR